MEHKYWEVAFVVTKVIRTQALPEASDDAAGLMRKHEVSLAVLATEFQQQLTENLSSMGIAAEDIMEIGVKEVK